jgi:hypothetical protein
MTIRNVLFVHALVALSATSARAEEPKAPVTVGGFVDLEWRALGLAQHVSHGPAFAAGVTLWRGKLRVGIGGLSRPGPWNPATFDVTLANGATYRGQRTVSLRSDGAMAGPQIALAFPVPRVPWLAVTLPFTVGYGGFGFYLHGRDRDTPDGRKVSEWEDELFDGRDSHLGVVIDGGVRLNVVLPTERWVRPYLGVYYTTVPGFGTVVRDSYAGFSGALGLELGYGL